MGETTAIGWTDHTMNPWWGCARVSPGCEHCYAEAFDKRVGRADWGKTAPRRMFGDNHWAEPIKWNRKALATGDRHLVFCASMADVFEDRDDLLDERARLWRLIADTPALTWQLLTKRPQNVRELAPAIWLHDWPHNVWIGTTIEDQQRADERLPHLTALPAPVRFLSAEPLLGHIDLTGWLEHIDWLIVGGESGPKHRPLDVDHARALRDQAVTAGVPFFFKQHGGHHPTTGGDTLDGRTWKQFPDDNHDGRR